MSLTKPILNIDSVNDVFKIPICYNKDTKKLKETVVSDLELTNTINNEDVPIYDYIFKPTNRVSKEIIKQFGQYYTTDTDYLKDSQKFIENMKREDINAIYNKHLINNTDIEDTLKIWEEIRGETGFCEKYLYIDWDFAKFLNNNPIFLQFMCIYNIASPILSLCIPIIVLIIPFFIIKMKGIELNIKEYIDILKLLIANHAITKIFTHFSEVDSGQKIYLIVSAAFYIFSIYQNILVCIRFYSNMKKIHNYLYKFKKYIDFSIDTMSYISIQSEQLTNYTTFSETLNNKMLVLKRINYELNKITPLNLSNGFKKLGEIGHIMHIFYQLYDNIIFNDAILYSFGFNGYFNMMYQLKSNIENNKMNKTQYITNKSDKTKLKPNFKNMFYPKFINENVV